MIQDKQNQSFNFGYGETVDGLFHPPHKLKRLFNANRK